MADARGPLISAVRRDLERARAAARFRLIEVREELDRAHERLDLVTRSAAEVPGRAAATRDARLAAAAATHADRLADLTALAREAADGYAPGAAGVPWQRWQPTPATRGTAPGLLRIGTCDLAGEVDPARAIDVEPVPVLVPLPDLGHVRLVAGPDARAVTDGIITTLLLRTLGRAEPGAVRLFGYDPERLGGGLAGFSALAAVGVLTLVGPGGLTNLLDDLVEQIRRIHETVLAGEYASLRDLAVATDRRPEPWRVVVLLLSGRPDELSRHELAQLERIVHTGPACGIHLVVRGMPEPADLSAVTTVTVGDAGVTVDGYDDLPVTLDPPPPADLVTGTSRMFAARVGAGPRPAAFSDLLPTRWWTRSSADGLTAPLGEGSDGRQVTVTLGDFPPHALIGGPSGTGKTNLIYAWLGSLAARYSPDELELYLLDFKEGVSFARFAPGRRDPSWLPHVRLVGINVNTDREFGLALLRHLQAELRRRAEAAKRVEATTLAELRAEDPQGRWPRIVAVVDEFQVLLAGRDAMTAEAAALLEDLARRGRSQGIHLVLASQDVSGIEALWGRSALIGQFTLRIALPKATRVLGATNEAAETIPRFHAVVNADSGAEHANRVIRVPLAGDRGAWEGVQHTLWQLRPAALAPPRLFDGDAVPPFPRLDAQDPQVTRPWNVVLGETIDVVERPATMRLTRAPGRNLAVLGTRVEEACAVLGAAARSLARTAPAGTRFSVACLDPSAAEAVDDLRPHLPGDTAWYGPDEITHLLAGAVAGITGAPVAGSAPHVLLLYAVDAVAHRLTTDAGDSTGHVHLRHLLNRGPERHTHVLGWWRGVDRLRDDLGGSGWRADTIGAWVALDVHGSELSPLYPRPGGPPWYPRPWRTLFFDRSVHRTAEVVIPYGLTD
jgi:hypothetical protein